MNERVRRSRRPRWPHRRAQATVLGATLGVLISISPAPAIGSGSLAARWEWPTAAPHLLMRGYEAAATRYAAGHRGIDLVAAAGSSVSAPADGVVSFAGWVVDRPVLSIRHPGGFVSSFEPVEASVAEGDIVTRGQSVGTVGESSHCAGCLHFGARHDGDYLSPLALLGGIPRAVLLPLDP